MSSQLKTKIFDHCFNVTEYEVEMNVVTEHHMGFKSLWRMTRGNRSEAIKLVKKLVERYTNQPWEDLDSTEFEADFDDYVADRFGGGCEIEWSEY